jgi:hypothetical protein
MSPSDLTLILGPVVGGALAWAWHLVRVWMRHRHGAP